MLKKIKQLKPEQLFYLLFFYNMKRKDTFIDTLTTLIYDAERDFKYKNELDIASSNLNMNVLIDVENIIDDIMFNDYDIYLYFKENLKSHFKGFENIEYINYMFKFVDVYESIISSTKFTFANTRTIQKMFYNKLLNIEIQSENYEKCNDIKNIIENVI